MKGSRGRDPSLNSHISGFGAAKPAHPGKKRQPGYAEHARCHEVQLSVRFPDDCFGETYAKFPRRNDSVEMCRNMLSHKLRACVLQSFVLGGLGPSPIFAVKNSWVIARWITGDPEAGASGL
jgi:hypothetical protein